MKSKTPLLLPLILVLVIVIIIFNNSNSPEVDDSDLVKENLIDDNSNLLEEEKDEVEDSPEEVQEEEEEIHEPKEEDNLEEQSATKAPEKDQVYIVENPDDILVLVNKNNSLPSDYIPSDLVKPNVRFPFEEDIPKRYLRQEAAQALEKLFEQADEDGITLFAVSGYRSYNRQKTLFDNKAKAVGTEKANLLVAYPGQSEHQTGLTIDLSSQSVGFTLEENFGEVAEGIWLKDNAHRAGFIIRYKKETEDITGYSYEPWHIRYVGQENAKEIYEKDITLEEFLEKEN